MSTTVTVSLGRFGPPPPVDDRHRGRVVYLPAGGVVVIVESRSASGGWRCGVIARRAPEPGRGHVVVSATDLDAAETAITVDPVADPDSWVMAWQARVWCVCLGGRKAVLGRALAERARIAGTVLVVLTSDARTKVMAAAHLNPYGLRSILAWLVLKGFLTPAPGQDGDATGTYELTIPGDTGAGEVNAS